MCALLCLVLVGCLAGNAFAGSLPSFIKACSESDPNLDQCITHVIAGAGPKFAEGVPSLGIEPLDPVSLGRIDIPNPALKIVFTDTVVTGLKTFRINSYKINTQKKKASIDFTANVTLKAHYNMDGQVLILPIKGDGAARIKIMNLNIVINYDYQVVKDAQGVNHWVVNNYTDNYKMDKAHFKFQNLFGGRNKELANTVHIFMNESWETVMKDVAPPAIEQIIAACVTVVNKFFSIVPDSELLLL